MSEHLTGRRTDLTGRSTGKFADSKFRKMNAVPQGQAFVWLTREMVESPAWRVMTGNARLVIDRVCIEHMAHAGGQNGFLPVTYADFERMGIRRGSISKAITEALELGFLEMPRKGTRGWGEFTGQPSHFRLAWLPTKEGEAPTTRWKRLKTMREAEEVANAARKSVANRNSTNEINSPSEQPRVAVSKVKSQ